MKTYVNSFKFNITHLKKCQNMGRKSVRKRCIAIIAVFYDKKITIELDNNENIKNKSNLEELTTIPKSHKRMIKENYKNLKLKRRRLRIPEIQSKNVSYFTKEFSFLDDISFETKIMDDFFNELAKEHSIILSNENKS